MDENALYQRFILTLSEDYCCRLLDGVDGIFTRRQVKPMHISLQDEERADIRRKLDQIMEQENDAAGRLAADSLCTLLLLRLQKFAQMQMDSAEYPAVQTQQFIRYINAHFTEQITLEDIAKRFFISKTHLMRQFKKYTHTTVHNYITTKRILLAKALLKENMAPAEVASACGFITYARFRCNAAICSSRDLPASSRVIELMDAFAGRMKFVFDPANYIQCGCKPLEIYPKLKSRIACFHIKDALVSDGRVVSAGAGDGNIRELLVDFAKNHEDTMLTVEPHLKVFTGLTDTVSMPSERDYVYSSNAEAFDVAVAALKNILEQEDLSYE